ncbi:lytic transglycosylase domain-containing protein [Sphingopyxis witflariensis]
MANALYRRRIAIAFAMRIAVHSAGLAATFALVSTSAAAAASSAIDPHPYAGPVAEAAQRFGIPEIWIWRVMHAESRGNRRAVSRAGAMGLMQIMPATWGMLTLRHGLGRDPFDVRANILAGAAYLRAMWDRYRDVRLMLAAYNAGPGRADAYAAGRRGLPAETVTYVRQIAPEFGASGTASSVPAPTRAVPGWQGASLFTQRESDKQPENSSAASTIAQTLDGWSPASRPPTKTSPNPLFVPLSGRGE